MLFVNFPEIGTSFRQALLEASFPSSAWEPAFLLERQPAFTSRENGSDLAAACSGNKIPPRRGDEIGLFAGKRGIRAQWVRSVAADDKGGLAFPSGSSFRRRRWQPVRSLPRPIIPSKGSQPRG